MHLVGLQGEEKGRNATADVAALTAAMEKTQIQLADLHGKFMTYMKYVQKRDLVIQMNFRELQSDNMVNFPNFLNHIFEHDKPEPVPQQQQQATHQQPAPAPEHNPVPSLQQQEKTTPTAHSPAPVESATASHQVPVNPLVPPQQPDDKCKGPATDS